MDKQPTSMTNNKKTTKRRQRDEKRRIQQKLLLCQKKNGRKNNSIDKYRAEIIYILFEKCYSFWWLFVCIACTLYYFLMARRKLKLAL